MTVLVTVVIMIITVFFIAETDEHFTFFVIVVLKTNVMVFVGAEAIEDVADWAVALGNLGGFMHEFLKFFHLFGMTGTGPDHRVIKNEGVIEAGFADSVDGKRGQRA